MTLLSILATITGTLMGVSNFPQAIKIFQRKSAKDISILTYTLLFFGAIIWVAYGFEIKNIAVILANGFGFLAFSSVIVGWFLYGKESNKLNKKLK